MKNTSLATSIISHKCPKCRQANLFETGPYNLKKFAKMPDRCPNCNQSFKVEPSFYTGAMYVSYGLQVGLFIAVFVALQVLYPEASAMVYVGIVASVAVILSPITLRFSRSIWIHLFVKHDPGVLSAKSE
ncbi:MAG: DUF983 domain-containing protein [bacterium]|nr:DUF983 domain-containing protein [bacterium]